MSDITLPDLTNENGEGVFDKLMSSMRGVLQEEFIAGRITSTDYSKVLISVSDSVLSQSMQFLLQKDQAAKQVEVLEAQRLLTVTQELLVQEEVLLASKNVEKLTREIELLDAQEDLLQAQVLLTEAQVPKIEAEVEVLQVEKNKISAEVLLVVANTAESDKKVEVLNAQLANIPKEGILLDKQALKTIEETTFLGQRILTEKAQIMDSIDGVSVSGVLSKQKNLYIAQTNGFAREAEFKVMKALVDTWVARRSTDEDTEANNVNHLDNTAIGAAVSKCLTEIGVTL